MKVMQSGRQTARRLIIFRRTCTPAIYLGRTCMPGHLILGVLVKFSGIQCTGMPVNRSPG